MKKYIGGVVALALLLAGCGSTATPAAQAVTRTAVVTSAVPTTVTATVTETVTATPPKAASFAIAGDLTLVGADHYTGGIALCNGSGGYSDISEGAQVNVYSADRKLVAATALGLGTANPQGCVFRSPSMMCPLAASHTSTRSPIAAS